MQSIKSFLNSVSEVLNLLKPQTIEKITMPLYTEHWRALLNIDIEEINELVTYLNKLIYKDIFYAAENEMHNLVHYTGPDNKVVQMRMFDDSDLMHLQFSSKEGEPFYTAYPLYRKGLHVSAPIKKIFLSENPNETEMIAVVNYQGTAGLRFMVVDCVATVYDLLYNPKRIHELELYGIALHITQADNSDKNYVPDGVGYSPKGEQWPNLFHVQGIVKEISADNFLGQDLYVLQLQIAKGDDWDLTVPVLLNRAKFPLEIKVGETYFVGLALYAYRPKFISLAAQHRDTLKIPPTKV
jgi:hypothetical protein